MESDKSSSQIIRKTLTPVLSVVLIDMIAFGMVIPLLPLFAERFKVSPVYIGLLFSCYSLLQLLASPVLGAASDRIGRKPILVLSLLGTSIGFLITALASSYWMLLLGRCVDGLTGGNIATANSYIADVTEPRNRATSYALMGAMFGVGLTLGPLIGGLFARWSATAPFFFATVISGANALYVWACLVEPSARITSTSSFSSFFRSGRWPALQRLLMGNFIFLLGCAIYQVMLALFTQWRYDFDSKDNAYLFGFLGVIIIVGQGACFPILKRLLSVRELLSVGILFTAGGLILMSFSASAAMLLSGVAVSSLGLSFAMPLISMLVSIGAGEEELGSLFGLNQSTGSFARLVGPVIGGELFSWRPAATMWVSGIMILLSWILFSRYMKHPLISTKI